MRVDPIDTLLISFVCIVLLNATDIKVCVCEQLMTLRLKVSLETTECHFEVFSRR